MEEFHQQKVWQVAHRLVLSTYNATKRANRDEYRSIIIDLRASATKVAAAIVAAYTGRSKNEFVGELKTAQSLIAQLEYHLLLARDLGCLDSSAVTTLTSELQETRVQLNNALSAHAPQRSSQRGKFPLY